MIENKSTHIKPKTIIKHGIYTVLRAALDLSENIYLKLKYIKFNYKDMLSDIFEEKDNSTTDTSECDLSENKHIYKIINWLVSLFGEINEEIIVSYRKNHKATFFLSKILLKRECYSVRKFINASILSLLFLIFFYFT